MLRLLPASTWTATTLEQVLHDRGWRSRERAWT